MSWKQPIPTNLEEIFGKDYLCQALYKELIYRSANKDGVWSMGETLSEIKRGQVIFGRIQFGRYLGWSPSRVERTLKKLVQKPDIITVIRRDKDCSVFYINNYEEITKMDITPDINRTSTGHQPDTSKSVKSVKNNKKEKNEKKERLTMEELMAIALRNKVSLQDVKDIEDDVFDSIENGNKYNVVSVKATVNTWLRRAIKNNQIETLDDISFEIMKRDHDPKLQERIRLTSLKMNQ